MYRLKLQKARSYRGYGIAVTQEKPVTEVEDEGTAQALLNSGYFRTVSEPEENRTADTDRETEPDYDALSNMSKADLTVYAKERNIDISKCKTMGTSVNYAGYVNDGHWTNSKGVAFRFVPGYWEGYRFIYDPSAKNGMGLKQHWVEGAHYWESALRILDRIYPELLDRKLQQWIDAYFGG